MAHLGATLLRSVTGNHHWVDFAKLLAKIAYATAVADGAATRLIQPSVVFPAILGHADDIGTWVGCTSGDVSH